MSQRAAIAIGLVLIFIIIILGIVVNGLHKANLRLQTEKYAAVTRAELYKAEAEKYLYEATRLQVELDKIEKQRIIAVARFDSLYNKYKHGKNPNHRNDDARIDRLDTSAVYREFSERIQAYNR